MTVEEYPGRIGSSGSWSELEALYSQGLCGEQKRRCICVGKGCGDWVYGGPHVDTGSAHNAGLSLFRRVMKLEARCGAASSEVPKPEKEAEPDAEPHSDTWPQEAAAKSRSGWGLEAEIETLGVESGPEAKAKSLGANPRSGSGPEAKAEPWDFVVATEREFEEMLAISSTTFSAATTAGSGIPTAPWCRPS